MVSAALFAAFHYIALGIGFGAIFARGRCIKALRKTSAVERREVLQKLFTADNLWGVAAMLWVITGLYRTFGGIEKGTAYYMGSVLFVVKMALFLLIFALEIPPMVTFIKWRVSLKKGQVPARIGEDAFLKRLFLMNHIQLGLICLIPIIASFMARGFGPRL